MRLLSCRVALATLVPLVLVAACSSSAPDPGPSKGDRSTTLRVGQLRANLEPLLDAAGQLSSLPYEIEWSSFDVGPDAIAAESAGAIDIAYMADTPPIFAQAAHIGVKIIGLTRAPGGARNVALLVGAGSDVLSVSDLADREIAVVPGTVTQYLLIEALSEAGLTLNDVRQVNVQGPEAIAALQAGDVEAAVLVDPLLATALAAGQTRVLLDGSGLLSGSNVLVAREQALQDRSRAEALEDLLARIKAALTWAADHPDAWAAIYGSTNHLSRQTALQAVQRSATILVPIDDAAIAAQQRQADAFTSIGLIRDPLDVAEEFDNRYNGALFGSQDAAPASATTTAPG
jgi:sulfonate transport system substrate-binding protein